ncbi:MAG: DEAD/DEAH box helicase [Gemmatimonadaceae bacterium]|nr:DEAD/DEAH box helicase [Gemmatimonadaceae bacterium]
MSEQEREETSPGATRSQHVVLQGPADVRMMAAAMRPGIERSRAGGQDAAPTCLVITPTPDQALTAADQARRLLSDDAARVVPVSGVTRARRVLAAGPVAVVTGAPSDLLALRRDAALDLEQLQTVVIIGLDEILANGGADTLQTLLGDAPGDVGRVATLDSESPETEAFLEAQMHRARRIAPPLVGDAPLAVTPRFVITSAAGRAEALRAVLDETDPPSLAVVAHTDQGVQQATDALTRLGLTVDGLLVQVVRQPTAQHVAMTVLWEAPTSYEALAEALAVRPVDAVALLLPDELPAFRRMTHNLAEAWTPAPKKAHAEERVQQLRTAVRSTLLNGGATASEMALLAPLLDSYDALEIACAALRLYEGAKRDVAATKARAAAAGAKPTAPRDARGESAATPASGRLKVFLAAGKRDEVRVGDIVGAIANEAGIPGERIGQVELYESHTTVELAADDAAKVVEALSGATLRGRRLSARIDERGGERGGARGGDRGGDRGGRGFGGPRGGGDRPRFGGDRSDRGDRGDRGERPRFGGGDRSGSRGERPARSFDRGDDRGDRGGRGFGGPPRGGNRPVRADDERRAFGDRPIRERTENRAEWSERAERMKHAKRPPRRPFGQDNQE